VTELLIYFGSGSALVGVIVLLSIRYGKSLAEKDFNNTKQKDRFETERLKNENRNLSDADLLDKLRNSK
jgi:hypothetical protein